MLIQKGANVNAVNKDSDSALILAASKGKRILIQSWAIHLSSQIYKKQKF